LIVLHGLPPSQRAQPPRQLAPRYALIDRQARYSQDDWLQRAPEMPLRGF
jgi:hypothetical protein